MLLIKKPIYGSTRRHRGTSVPYSGCGGGPRVPHGGDGLRRSQAWAGSVCWLAGHRSPDTIGDQLPEFLAAEPSGVLPEADEVTRRVGVFLVEGGASGCLRDLVARGPRGTGPRPQARGRSSSGPAPASSRIRCLRRPRRRAIHRVRKIYRVGKACARHVFPTSCEKPSR